MVCSKCGQKLPKDSEFCQYCGAPIPKEQVQDTMASAQVFAEVMASYAVKSVQNTEANKGIENQYIDDPDFGLVPQKPVYTKGIEEQKKYIASLQTDNGRKIKWERRGSISVRGINGMVDVYEASITSGKPYNVIYMNMYGADNSSGVPQGFARKESAAYAQQNAPRKSHSKVMVGIGASVISIAIIAFLVVTFLIPWMDYNHAKELLESGNYDLAYSAFSKLGDYSNSKEMLKETRYLQAVKYRENGNYELANHIFESLGNYRDSKLLIHEHEYKLSDIMAATCTADGKETYTCSECGSFYIKTIDKVDHTYIAISTIEASCTTEGIKTYQCTGCNITYEEQTAKISHEYVITESEESTCQKGGYKTYECTLCSDQYTQNTAKIAHTPVLTSSKDATCTSKGEQKYKCTTCSYSYTVEVAKKSHSYSAATCTKPKTCSACGKTEGSALGHSGGGAKCSRCGQVTFKTLTYSGTGSKVFKNVTVPNGKYIISGYAFSTNGRSGSFYVYLNYSNGKSAAYWIEALFSDKQSIEKAVSFDGPITGGILEISADDNVSWTITIEAVGN